MAKAKDLDTRPGALPTLIKHGASITFLFEEIVGIREGLCLSLRIDQNDQVWCAIPFKPKE